MILGVAINSLISQFIGPKLLYKYGQGSSLISLFKESFQVSIYILIAMIIFSPIILFGIKVIINIWLPLFTEALPLINLFYIAGILAAMNHYDIIFSAANRPVIMFFQNIALVIIAFLVFYLASLGPIVWFAYSVIFLQFIKLISSLIINLYLAKNTL